MSVPTLSSSTRFVLVGTSHAGNVGSAARAVKVMGFEQLILVAPRFDNVLRKQETIALASGAVDVLENTRIVDTLADALDGVTHACAMTARLRDFGPPAFAPREYLPTLAQDTQAQVAFVFGSERYGLSNEDVYRCHAVLSVPANPAYSSLNLAMTVNLIAYEWRQALMAAHGGFDIQPRTQASDLASVQAVQGTLEHWQEALIHIGFLDPQAPKKLMPRLNQLFNRAHLTQEEVHILRGIAKAMLDH